MTPIEFLSDSAKLYQDTVLPVRKKYGLTYMEFGVLMFLYNNPQYNTAAQIVSMRHIPKSHVSISVKSLMEKGLLHGEKCKDKRAVRLSVTEFAEEIARSGKSAQKNFVDTLYGGFSEAERSAFSALLDKMETNVAEHFDLKRS